MKRTLFGMIGISALLAFAPFSNASAADMNMPLKAPMAMAPAPSWTGCYLDAGWGYGMSNLDQHQETFPGLGTISGTYTDGGRGWLGRLGAGCDYQVAPRFVIGIFGDYDFQNIHGGFSPGNLALFGQEKESDAWYAGGRIGYLVTPALMTYFSGGYTATRFDQINLSGLVAPFALSNTIGAHTYSGWFLGGGTEYALNFDWLPIHGLFWRNEYRYSSYGSADLPLRTLAGVTTAVGEHISPYNQTITSSLVWRFNWTGR